MSFEQKLKSKIECEAYRIATGNNKASFADTVEERSIVKGANLLAPLLVDCENNIKTAVMYLESTDVIKYEPCEPEFQMYLSLKQLLKQLEQFTEEPV